MVDFYHDLGIIIKHCSTVIVSAEWLIDLFKQLITIPPFDKTVRSEIRSLSVFKPRDEERRPKRNYKKPPRITGFLITSLSRELKKL